MYIAARHAETRVDAIQALIRSDPLGAIVRAGASGLEADHIPFELVPPTPEAPHGLLRAHVARANPLWRQDGAAVLVLFRGAAGYVSPLRHDLAAVGGRMVPTWDYAVVHAHGRLRTVEDGDWILAHMRRMTVRQEGERGWAVDDAPHDYITQLLKATVGIEIAIEGLEAKTKRSAMHETS